MDLGTLDVRTESITANSTANSTAGASRNKTGADAWGALTAEEKIRATEALIKEHVAQAVPALFAAQ